MIFSARQGEIRRRPLGRAVRCLLPALIAALAACGKAAPASPELPSPPPPVVSKQAQEPARVQIPAISVDSEIMPVALKSDGAMQTPDFGLAGWYNLGPRPGQAGPAVVVGHVDSKSGPDVFFRLRELHSGDEIVIKDKGGATHKFVVEQVEQVAKDRLPADRIWSADDRPVLRLLTCGGQFDRKSGHYRDNIIVYASEVRA